MTITKEVRLPVIVRSAQDLLSRGTSLVLPDALVPLELPISREGTTYDMAQSAAWVDADHFAVGRWGGSLCVFKFSEAKDKGPLIAVAASSPSSEGVQMITWVAPGVIATSNDDHSIAIWRPNEAWNRLECLAQLTYDPRLGAANSGDAVLSQGQVYLVVGHANGFVTVWEGAPEAGQARLVTEVDVRSDRPTNPWGLHNVRGVAAIEVEGSPSVVVTGSEDGDLCLIEIPSGAIRSRRVYSPHALRGVNAVAADGFDVLVANCSVGPQDQNLWLYHLDPGTWDIVPKDAVNLVLDPCAAQIFNFAVVWGQYAGGRCFFASTQEGALWMGQADGRISVLGHLQVTSPLGAALAYASNGNLAFVAYDLHEFKTLPERVLTTALNPHRLHPMGS